MCGRHSSGSAQVGHQLRSISARCYRSERDRADDQERNILKKLGEAEERDREDQNDSAVDLDTIILAGIERGLTITDIKKLQLGQVVDYCLAFNERHKDEVPQEKKPKQKPKKKYRKATQEEIRAYFG